MIERFLIPGIFPSNILTSCRSVACECSLWKFLDKSLAFVATVDQDVAVIVRKKSKDREKIHARVIRNCRRNSLKTAEDPHTSTYTVQMQTRGTSRRRGRSEWRGRRKWDRMVLHPVKRALLSVAGVAAPWYMCSTHKHTQVYERRNNNTRGTWSTRSPVLFLSIPPFF